MNKLQHEHQTKPEINVMKPASSLQVFSRGMKWEH